MCRLRSTTVSPLTYGIFCAAGSGAASAGARTAAEGRGTAAEVVELDEDKEDVFGVDEELDEDEEDVFGVGGGTTAAGEEVSAEGGSASGDEAVVSTELVGGFVNVVAKGKTKGSTTKMSAARADFGLMKAPPLSFNACNST